MLDTNCKIYVFYVYRNLDGLPALEHYNKHYDIIIKAKTTKRVSEIANELGIRFDYAYAREMGHNKSKNSTYLKFCNEYSECVMWSNSNAGWDHKLYDKFDNKKRDMSTQNNFKLNISENMKNIIENGISFDKLLKG